MKHAENGPAIDVLVAQALQRGETAPNFHSLTRPVEMEEEATHRAIMLAKVAKAPVYIVHMSAKEAVETVSRARDMGANVFGETCPQYLYFSLEEHLMKPGFEGAAYVCSTPLRARAEGHQEALWRYLRTNDLSVVATDHCPFCMKEQKELGVGDFSKIPNGIGGVEHRMDTIYQGVVTGEISLSRWVELCATTPARMFGLYPQKGVLLPGSDADVVVYDPNAKTKIGVNDTHHMNMDHSAYEGMVIDGKVDTVISRGQVVVEGGSYVGQKGHGRYLKRGLSQYLV
jgi:dihydropyrimidinase